MPVLANVLQTLFSTHARRLARDTGLIRRQRQLTGPDFARVLVFGWVEDPTASRDTLTDELPLRGGRRRECVGGPVGCVRR